VVKAVIQPYAAQKGCINAVVIGLFNRCGGIAVNHFNQPYRGAGRA